MSTLHRHALESVLGFLKLRELHAAVRVCAEWRGAVGSMRPINATLGFYIPLVASLREVGESQPTATLLGRQVGAVGTAASPVNVYRSAALGALVMHFPRLRELYCACNLDYLTPERPLLLPPLLRVLRLELFFSSSPAEDEEDLHSPNPALAAAWARVQAAEYASRLERVLESIGQCEQLEAVRLTVYGGWDWRGREDVRRASLRTLLQLPRLESLELIHVELAACHVAEVRALGYLRHCDLELSKQDSTVRAKILAPPGAPRWQHVGFQDCLNDGTAELLSLLPSLTKLHAGSVTVTEFDWLRRLPLLRSVHLVIGSKLAVLAAAAATLRFGAQWRELELDKFYNATPTHMQQLLSALPQLELLRLRRGSDLYDLQWLRAAPASLTELRLEEVSVPWQSIRPVPNAEAVELERLTSLRSLQLIRVFEMEQPAAVALEQRLCGALPRLTQFIFQTCTPSTEGIA